MIPFFFVAPVCFWQVKWNTFVGHINVSSLKRVQEGPNHVLSVAQLLRDPAKGREGCWAVLCKRRGDRARSGRQSPGLVGLSDGCCFVLGCSWGISVPWHCRHHGELRRGSGDCHPCSCRLSWDSVGALLSYLNPGNWVILSLGVLCNLNLFCLKQNDFCCPVVWVWLQLPTECWTVMGALRCNICEVETSGIYMEFWRGSFTWLVAGDGEIEAGWPLPGIILARAVLPWMNWRKSQEWVLWAVIHRAWGERPSSGCVCSYSVWRLLQIGLSGPKRCSEEVGSSCKQSPVSSQGGLLCCLEELGEFECSCVGGEEGFVVELLGIKKASNLASQKWEHLQN